MKYSTPSNTSATTATSAASAANREQETSAASRIKSDCLSFGVCLQEGFRYVKAILVGQAKKLTARDEKEATTADLQAQKMQVEAADKAEKTKEKIYKSK